MNAANGTIQLMKEIKCELDEVTVIGTESADRLTMSCAAVTKHHCWKQKQLWYHYATM